MSGGDLPPAGYLVGRDEQAPGRCVATADGGSVYTETSYSDGAWVRFHPTASASLAELAAAALPGQLLTGYLRVQGRWLMAAESRADGWTARAAAYRGGAVVVVTPTSDEDTQVPRVEFVQIPVVGNGVDLGSGTEGRAVSRRSAVPRKP